MTVGLILPTGFLFISILLNIIYFSKERLNNYENKLYKCIIVTNLVSLLLEFPCTFLTYEEIPFLTDFVIKIYLISLLSYIQFLTLYISTISKKEEVLKYKWKTLKKQYFTIFCIFAIFIIFGNVELITTKLGAGAKGLAVSVLHIQSIVCAILWGINIIGSKNHLPKKKYIPFLVYLILSLLIAVIQLKNPGILLITPMETFVALVMYFTIENPDMKMIEELELAREQADKANRAKTDFLSSMSHEIRTPLNAIVGFSDCIEASPTLEEAKNNAKDIVNASQTLLEIVNGILDISKIEAGKLEIINSPYQAKDTFTELAKLITPKMDEKALDFSYYIAPDLPKTLYGDHTNIKKIITNLLSNACKYTEKGFVRYEVNCINSKDVCKLIISVEDSGRGIKQESVDKLFTKFQRLDEDKNTTIEGTGLGLAITKQLIELMGGRIIVHTIYGEGSKFTVILNQKIETQKVIEPSKKVKTTLNLKDEKILLVDDNELNLKVATKLLEKYNATKITKVDSGFACLDRISAGEKYDVILLDDMMPKMSGVETLKKLKELPSFNTPVIALTANAITGMREKYLADGFNDYLAKPIEKEQLIQVLNEVLGKEITEQLEIITPNEKEEIEELDIIEEDITSIEVNSNSYDDKFLRQHGVDMDKSLELLGDMEMYNMTIKDFLAEVEDKWSNIKKYKENKDMPNYAIEVHSLKSDCKYLGLMKLADLSYQHELKSKDNDQIFVDNHFQELEEEFNAVLFLIKEYASHIN